MDDMTMVVAVTSTGMIATGLLIPTKTMGTDITATETGITAETAVEKGAGQEASLAIAAAGMGQGHLL